MLPACSQADHISTLDGRPYGRPALQQQVQLWTA